MHRLCSWSNSLTVMDFQMLLCYNFLITFPRGNYDIYLSNCFIIFSSSFQQWEGGSTKWEIRPEVWLKDNMLMRRKKQSHTRMHAHFQKLYCKELNKLLNPVFLCLFPWCWTSKPTLSVSLPIVLITQWSNCSHFRTVQRRHSSHDRSINSFQIKDSSFAQVWRAQLCVVCSPQYPTIHSPSSTQQELKWKVCLCWTLMNYQ